MREIIQQTGIVRSIDGGQAVIAVEVQGCASCGRKSSCGIGQLAGAPRTTLIRLPAQAAMQTGAAFTLQATQDEVLRAALRAYLLPALTIVIGTVLGEHLLAGDVGAAVGAVAGFALGMLPLRAWPPRTGAS